MKYWATIYCETIANRHEANWQGWKESVAVAKSSKNTFFCGYVAQLLTRAGVINYSLIQHVTLVYRTCCAIREETRFFKATHNLHYRFDWKDLSHQWNELRELNQKAKTVFASKLSLSNGFSRLLMDVEIYVASSISNPLRCKPKRTQATTTPSNERETRDFGLRFCWFNVLLINVCMRIKAAIVGNWVEIKAWISVAAVEESSAWDSIQFT